MYDALMYTLVSCYSYLGCLKVTRTVEVGLLINVMQKIK